MDAVAHTCMYPSGNLLGVGDEFSSAASHGNGVQHEMDLERRGAMGGGFQRGAFAARKLIPS